MELDYASPDQETGDERFRLRRKKRVREESSNETVVLALLNVQTPYLLRYRRLKSFRLTILVHFC